MIRIEETEDLSKCHAIRREVFIEEQGVSEAEEIDDLDGEAVHLLALDGDVAVGTARLLFTDELGKIGRVAVVRSHRGTGLGKALMEASLDVIRSRGFTRAKLSSQVHAIGFYETLGFAAQGPEYDDAGIPHRDMYADLTP